MKINNNILVAGLLVALIVAVGGTWISLSYIDSLTGAATTGTGTTNLSITSVVSCSMVDSNIDFGTMARGASNQSSGGNGTGDYMQITNDGNTNLTITINATSDLWSAQSAPSTYWLVACNSTTDSGATCNTTLAQTPSATPHQLISSLTPVDTTDDLYVGMNITVPSDEPAGSKLGTVTFYCSQT